MRIKLSSLDLSWRLSV